MGLLARRRVLAATALAPFIARPAHATSTLLVAVGASSSLTDLSLSALRAIFLGQSVENPAGQKIICFNDAPGTPTRALFERMVLKMSPADLSRHWVDRMIRGQSGPPRAAPTADTRQKLVMRFPDALTYVMAGELSPGTRAITIDGKRPEDPSYPLTG